MKIWHDILWHMSLYFSLLWCKLQKCWRQQNKWCHHIVNAKNYWYIDPVYILGKFQDSSIICSRFWWGEKNLPLGKIGGEKGLGEMGLKCFWEVMLTLCGDLPYNTNILEINKLIQKRVYCLVITCSLYFCAKPISLV